MEQRDENQDQSSSKGKVKEVLGWATGDRDVEAAGRAEAVAGDEPEVVEEAKEQVRKDHRDVPVEDS